MERYSNRSRTLRKSVEHYRYEEKEHRLILYSLHTRPHRPACEACGIFAAISFWRGIRFCLTGFRLACGEHAACRFWLARRYTLVSSLRAPHGKRL